MLGVGVVGAEKDRFISREERRMKASPQGLKEPEQIFSERIYWRVNWPIQIFFLKI